MDDRVLAGASLAVIAGDGRLAEGQQLGPGITWSSGASRLRRAVEGGLDPVTNPAWASSPAKVGAAYRVASVGCYDAPSIKMQPFERRI